MKYYKIKEKLEDLIIFSSKDLYRIDPDFRLPTLYDWEARGLVKKIRNNNYVFSDFKPFDKDYYFIANKLYEPSYISLESALNFYGIIPEAVVEFTSVSSNKTNKFKNEFGVFTYSSVDSKLFFGYKIIEYKSLGLQVSSLEKAILDYLYLNPSVGSVDDLEGLRWNKNVLKEDLDLDEFEKYLVIFDNKSLQKRCNILLDYLNA